MKIVYNPEAKEDLLRIKRYIWDELQNPDAAVQLIRKITDDIALLRKSPNLGVAYEARTGIKRDARILVSGHYWIVYYVEKQVTIIQVVDTRRDYMHVLGSYPIH